jgi:hypothetical protein
VPKRPGGTGRRAGPPPTRRVRAGPPPTRGAHFPPSHHHRHHHHRRHLKEQPARRARARVCRRARLVLALHVSTRADLCVLVVFIFNSLSLSLARARSRFFTYHARARIVASPTGLCW